MKFDGFLFMIHVTRYAGPNAMRCINKLTKVGVIKLSDIITNHDSAC